MIRGTAGAAFAACLPAWARAASPGLETLSGADIALRIAHQTMRIDGRDSHAIGVNGTVPGPLIRLREGQKARLSVTNHLDEDSSIHWHGLLLPFQFDGVPGVSFPGIRPHATFVYEFPVIQAGTYWYHSHSGLQEQAGLYGPIVIDPAGPDPVAYDREHVIVLSDHSPLHPHLIFRKLKQRPGYFNRQPDAREPARRARPEAADRIEWGRMRMDPTDISDVTGATYSYLVNGHGPADNWTALFRPGERVRLRFINAAAMTNFNVRIPGLRLTIVQADGQDVRPVTVDEFQIAVAETFDAIVTPPEDRAYTIVGEAVDRSGLARATLAPRAGMAAEVPPLRARPVADMKDMGMGDHAAMGHDMSGMNMRDPANAPRVKLGPGVQTISPMPVDRTGEPGQGLQDAGHRVLVYRDLAALARNPDVRPPGRTIEFHLTGNMERYMWSFDGVKFSEAGEPIAFARTSGCASC